MKLYKLTDANGRTCGDTQWGEGITHTATGSPDKDLCSDGWIHAYEHPLLAVLLNPIGANFADPQMWEAGGEVGKREGQLKCGCRSLKTMKRMDLPVISLTQKVAFGILCAKTVTKDKAWEKWADDWLSRKDRTEAAARAAARAARAAAQAAEWAARAWARAASEAAWAAWAARAAEAAAPLALDLIVIAQKAMEYTV